MQRSRITPRDSVIGDDGVGKTATVSIGGTVCTLTLQPPTSPRCRGKVTASAHHVEARGKA